MKKNSFAFSKCIFFPFLCNFTTRNETPANCTRLFSFFSQSSSQSPASSLSCCCERRSPRPPREAR